MASSEKTLREQTHNQTWCKELAEAWQEALVEGSRIELWMATPGTSKSVTPLAPEQWWTQHDPSFLVEVRRTALEAACMENAIRGCVVDSPAAA